MLWLPVPAFLEQWVREEVEGVLFVAWGHTHSDFNMELCFDGWCFAHLCFLAGCGLVLGCKDTTAIMFCHHTLGAVISALVVTPSSWFSLQKKWLIYSFIFIWGFFQKGVKLLECIVKNYKQPPKGSNLTGMLGGRSSDCLMKMNGENCWYKNHVVGA